MVKPQLWHSGVLVTAAAFFAGIGNYAFQVIVGRSFSREEFGLLNSSLGLIPLMIIPVQAGGQALIHYIARFRANHNASQLQGLLRGSRRFLLHLTLWSTVGALVLIAPISDFFGFPRWTLTVATLGCILTQLWTGYGQAILTGMAWYGRLALVMTTMVFLRLAYGGIIIQWFPMAEAAVSATGIGALAFLLIVLWGKEISSHEEVISPWNAEFGRSLLACCGYALGTFAFVHSDLLVAQRNLSPEMLGSYSNAGLFGRALIHFTLPILLIFFTSISEKREGLNVHHLKLLGLYLFALVGGLITLYLLRYQLTAFVFKDSAPYAAAMVGRFAIAMSVIGIVQGIATWALGSGRHLIVLLYTIGGTAYWISNIQLGANADQILEVMLYGAIGTLLLVIVGSAIDKPRSPTAGTADATEPAENKSSEDESPKATS